MDSSHTQILLCRHIVSKNLTLPNIYYGFHKLRNKTADLICYFHFSEDFLSILEKLRYSIQSFTYLMSRYLSYVFLQSYQTSNKTCGKFE